MLLDHLTIIRDPAPHDAAQNMALDEALLASVAEAPLLRIYRWQRAAVSFGYFGKHAPVAAAWPGREIVRRMTGGGVVPHGDDITYTLVIPSPHPLAQSSARESYRAIHDALARWLLARGLRATLAPSPMDRGNGVCFESAAEADVLAGGRKLAGAAQRRAREGLLYQGSIQGVPDAWRDELPAAFCASADTRDFTSAELARAATLAATKYATREWTERV